jgi:hypothetical protein
MGIWYWRDNCNGPCISMSVPASTYWDGNFDREGDIVNVLANLAWHEMWKEDRCSLYSEDQELERYLHWNLSSVWLYQPAHIWTVNLILWLEIWMLCQILDGMGYRRRIYGLCTVVIRCWWYTCIGHFPRYQCTSQHIFGPEIWSRGRYYESFGKYRMEWCIKGGSMVCVSWAFSFGEILALVTSLGISAPVSTYLGRKFDAMVENMNALTNLAWRGI